MIKDSYPVPPTFAKTAHVTSATYQDWYERSLSNPEAFWGEQAKRFVSWFEPWDKVLSGGFDRLDVKWFQSGKLNAAYNCLDRHLEKRANQAAIIWEGDDPASSQIITYQMLYERVCLFANVLKQLGVQKGDRVCIYLPMILYSAISMLARAHWRCAFRCVRRIFCRSIEISPVRC